MLQRATQKTAHQEPLISSGNELRCTGSTEEVLMSVEEKLTVLSEAAKYDV